VSVATVELRAYGIVSRMQPRYAAYEATVADGDIPLMGMAQLFVELAPGNEIYRLADAALKATSVRPSSQVVEREFEIVYALTDEPWGVRRFFVRDPNGMVINVMSHHSGSGGD
jgi:hypothetical protein